MSGNSMLFLVMRVVHVALAGAWFGAAAFTTLYLGPAIGLAGPAGGQVMSALVKKGSHQYIASIGGLTVLTGIYLFWRFTGGFDPALSGSRAGITFSIGALAGLIALILGGSMIGGSIKKAVALGEQMARMPEGADKAAVAAQINALRARIETFSPIVLGLLFIAMAAMALGHYV